MATSEFDTWFVAQFGPCPMSDEAAVKLKMDIQGVQFELSRMKTELLRYDNWHFNETAARYAWNYKGGR